MIARTGLQLPEDRSALVVLQDRTSVTAGVIEQQYRSLAAMLAGRGAGRALLPTDRADHVVMALLACRAAGCDLVLHRGPLHTDGLVEEMGADAIIEADLSVEGTAKAVTPRTGDSKVVLMTSGTTGIPKAASHDMECLTALIPEGRPGPAARWLLTYHPASFAGFQVILTALLSQSPFATLSSIDASSAARLAVDFKPTSISGTPTFWRAFLMALDNKTAALALRHATLGGEAVDQATLDRIRANFPAARVTHIYASTEAGAVFAVKDGRAGFPAAWLSAERNGLRMRLVDGVLQLQSPQRMTGYVSARDVPFDNEGWFDTGDLVRIDGDRALFDGRKTSIINVGGQKVRPEEVEAVVLAVAGVVDAHVKGVRNPITGELVAVDVMVVPGADKTKIAQAIRALGKDLPAYAVPRIVNFVPDFPVTVGGKKRRA